MKKLILLPILFILSQCDIKVETQSSMAGEFPVYGISQLHTASGPRDINVTVYKRANIEFLLKQDIVVEAYM